MSDVVFGLATYKGAISGLQLQNVSVQQTGQQGEPLNENAEINQIDLYAGKWVFSATGNVVEGSDVSALVRGGSLTVNGITYKITNVTDGEVVNGNKTYQINAEAPMRSAGSGT